MRAAVQGIGWFVRRSADPASHGTFYRDVFGLPELRNYGPTKMLWVGETVDLEPGAGGTLPPPRRDWEHAPCLPVFQVQALEPVIRRLESQGVRFAVKNVMLTGGRYAWFTDPAGNATGLVQRPAESVLADRWQPATISLPGVPALTGGLIRLGEVIRHCQDVGAITAFYRDAVGLMPLEGTSADDEQLLALGATTMLRIAAGGDLLEVPEDRQAVVDGFILRVDDVDGMYTDLIRLGTAGINPPFDIDGGRIAYLADPEGQVFGIQTRLPATNRVEDHEAMRR